MKSLFDEIFKIRSKVYNEGESVLAVMTISNINSHKTTTQKQTSNKAESIIMFICKHHHINAKRQEIMRKQQTLFKFKTEKPFNNINPICKQNEVHPAHEYLLRCGKTELRKVKCVFTSSSFQATF